MNVAQSSLLPLVVDNEDGTCTPVVATADTVTVVTGGYDLGAFIAGEPEAGSLVLRHIAVRAFNLSEDLAGSLADAVVAADAEAVFSIQANGVEFATLTFAAAGDTGTFAGAETLIDIGDVLSILAPDPADADLADVAISLLGELA